MTQKTQSAELLAQKQYEFEDGVTRIFRLVKEGLEENSDEPIKELS